MMNSLKEVVKHPYIHRGRAVHDTVNTRLKFNNEQLNNATAGGVPIPGMVRVNCQPGSQELSFFSQMLVPAQQPQKRVVFINPPGNIYPRWLIQQGWDEYQPLVLKTHSQADLFWSCETVMRSGVCQTLFVWTNQCETAHARRLQTLATQYHCVLLCIDYRKSQPRPLPINLDCRIYHQNAAWYFDVLKVRGGWPVNNIPFANNPPVTNRPIVEAFGHNKAPKEQVVSG